MGLRNLMKQAKQMPGMFKALKEMKKQGGMALCKECLKRQVEKTAQDPEQAMQDSINSGMYKEAVDKKCFVCNTPADYIISLNDAMEGMRAHKK